jgi:hypothetical protein
MRAVELRSGGELVGYLVRCPACEADDAGSTHQFAIRMNDGSPGWTFNGDFERPTFRPSMLATCTLGEEHRPHRCHSFVTDGRIQYLGDCTHAMAGQTIELPTFEDS